MWARIRRKRKAYKDLPDLDVEATQSAIKKLPKDDQGLVRMIQSGARRDVANLVHCGIRKDLRCSCGFDTETLEHIVLDCPDKAASRNASNQLLAAFRKLPPAILRHCLVPLDTCITTARESLFDIIEAPVTRVPLLKRVPHRWFKFGEMAHVGLRLAVLHAGQLLRFMQEIMSMPLSSEDGSSLLPGPS